MNAYILPIKYALITFPILAALLTLPFLIVQYRKYGYVNKFRSLILYSFLLYCLSAYYLVILPLPNNLNNCVREGSFISYMQLVPFHFVRDISDHVQFSWSSPMSYLALIKEPAFYQVLFNICLTMPLGIYLRYYFRKGFKQVWFFSMITACFFEITQLSGLYGIYTCPYRLFDVDDLMVNTFGGLLGFWLAPMFTYFLPRSDELDDKVELEHMTVGFIRRGISWTIDLLCMGMLVLVVAAVIIGIDYLGIGLKGLEWSYTIQYLLITALVVLLYMIVLPTLTGGKTIGKMITRIHVIDDKRRGQPREITFVGLFKRYGLIYYVTIGFFLFLWLIMNYGVIPGWGGMFAVLLGCIAATMLAIHLLLRIFSRDKLLFYERISGTRNVITLRPTLSAIEKKNDIEQDDTVVEGEIPAEQAVTIGLSHDEELDPNNERDLMSASTIPMSDAIDRELERIKNKLKNRDK